MLGKIIKGVGGFYYVHSSLKVSFEWQEEMPNRFQVININLGKRFSFHIQQSQIVIPDNGIECTLSSFAVVSHFQLYVMPIPC